MQKRLKSHEHHSEAPLSMLQPNYVFRRHVASDSPSGFTDINAKRYGNRIVKANKKNFLVTGLAAGTASTKHSFEQSRRRRSRCQAVAWVGVLLAAALLAAPTFGATELYRVSVTAEETSTNWVGCSSSASINQCKDGSGDRTFNYEGARYLLNGFTLQLSREVGSRAFTLRWADAINLGELSDLISTRLTLSVNDIVLNFSAATTTTARRLRWENTSVDFAEDDTVTLVIEEPDNNPPTAVDSSVTTDEDTDYTFSENDFQYTDDDSVDELESVTVTTLPTASLGTLQLDGTAVRANGQVTKAQLDARNLVFVPAAHANGNTTFMFTVNDGEDDSAAAATMTVNVTAVNDSPTGLPDHLWYGQVGR